MPRTPLGTAANGMTSECSRRTELAELMADHILGDENGCKVFSIVNHQGVADKFWDNCATACPRLNRFMPVHLVECLDFTVHLFVDVRSFFQ